jgi:hypothetical protein
VAALVHDWLTGTRGGESARGAVEALSDAEFTRFTSRSVPAIERRPSTSASALPASSTLPRFAALPEAIERFTSIGRPRLSVSHRALSRGGTPEVSTSVIA